MTSLTLLRRIAASPDVVFDAVTTPEGIACWWGPDAGPVLSAETDLRIGGRFRVRFRMLDDTEHETTGEFLELQRPSKVAMSWHWHGQEGEGVSRLDISLRPIDVGTELTLTHSLLKSDRERDGHRDGWNGALDKLEKHFQPSRGSIHA